jgi:hypothetical protein
MCGVLDVLSMYIFRVKVVIRAGFVQSDRHTLTADHLQDIYVLSIDSICFGLPSRMIHSHSSTL